MKNNFMRAIASTLVFSSIILSNYPAFSQVSPSTQEDPATSSANRPGSPAHPLTPEPDPNKVIEKEKSGKVIPEQIKHPDDLCADEVTKTELDNKKLPKRKCTNKPNGNGKEKPKPPLMPSTGDKDY